MGALIQCKDLWKVYQLGDVSVPALRGVSLDIEHGELLAIMGASGSGKTTLMNILGCLDRPSQGTYCLDGRDVAQALPNDLAEIRNLKIGFVFQNFSLIPRTSALENVQLPLLYRGVPLHQQRQQASEALNRVGLGDRQRHFPSQLSGGQQQRVAIARALVARPAILLADEPTGNLDTESSQEIMSILTDLNRTDGMTVILVTHEPDVAAYAGRQLMMKDGHLVSDRRTATAARVGRGLPS